MWQTFPALQSYQFLCFCESMKDDTSGWVYFGFMSVMHVAGACPNILEISGLKVY